MARTLDPQAQALLDAAARARALPLASITPRAARERLRAGFLSHGPGPDVFGVANIAIPSFGRPITARVYRAKRTDEPFILFLHGGGGVVNSVETHDRLARLICANADATVVSLDYRLAPENPYPAALEDAVRAWAYLASNSARHGLAGVGAIMGDSSGGALAFGVAAMALDLGLPMPEVQCLLYPTADHYSAGFESYASRGKGYSLDAPSMKWFWDNFLPQEWSPVDGYLFPLRRPSFEALPATILATAEFDPLRDEGRALARRLLDAGVAVEYYDVPDQMHGWAMQTKTIDAAMSLVQTIAARTGEVLRGASLVRHDALEDQ